MSGALVRRLLLPMLCIFAVIAATELALEWINRPGLWERTSWLMHDPYRGEIFDRVVVYKKLSHFENSDPEIISVGDSSGFFSLQSKIVMRYLEGHRYLSLNTGANQAYAGYKAIAEYMLRRSPHLRYVVLYLYPQLLPSEGLFKNADLGPILYDDLIGTKAWATPPSASLSPYAKSWLFKSRFFDKSEPMAVHVPALELGATIDEALGWLPEFDVRFDRVNGRAFFYSDGRTGWDSRLGLSDPSMLNSVLDDFDRMVRSYGAQLVVAFAPIGARAPEIGDRNILIAEQELARFQRQHPDVKFLFPLITRFGSEKFGENNHISREYTFLSSERLGTALARLLADPGSLKPFVPSYRDPGFYPKIDIAPVGPPDAGPLLNSALALYLFASTSDDRYRQLISRRVLSLLDGESAFRSTMEDARARAASLHHRGIEIGFDLSQLKATPVTVTGLPFCVGGQDLQWVQIDGTMIFTYKSPAAQSTAPVAWPQASHILVPTVVEDGVRKFDGYCSEPSVREAAVALH